MRVTKVRDAMTSPVVRLHPTDTIHEAAGLFTDAGISGAPVVVDGRVVGMLTEWDILRVVAPGADPNGGRSVLGAVTDRVHGVGRGQRGPLVADAMSHTVWAIRPTASIWEAAYVMQRRGIRRLPVIDEEGLLEGLLSYTDIVRVVGRTDEEIRSDVAAAVDAIADEVGAEAVHDLDVVVEDGTVTLKGTAEGRWGKRLASEVAALTPGTFAVHDEVAVRTTVGSGPRPAGWAFPLLDAETEP
ncbi:MAG: CBS domain-containing protein, partial [Actinomycetota bacterium]